MSRHATDDSLRCCATSSSPWTGWPSPWTRCWNTWRRANPTEPKNLSRCSAGITGAARSVLTFATTCMERLNGPGNTTIKWLVTPSLATQEFDDGFQRRKLTDVFCGFGLAPDALSGKIYLSKLLYYGVTFWRTTLFPCIVPILIQVFHHEVNIWIDLPVHYSNKPMTRIHNGSHAFSLWLQYFRCAFFNVEGYFFGWQRFVIPQTAKHSNNPTLRLFSPTQIH